MDWKSQPDPFRRYEGTDNIPLRHFQENQGPSFSETLRGYSVKVSGMDFDSISQLFYDSLAISAWKSYQDTKWALRVNPSSGNLHPTESYLISGPIRNLTSSPTISHYSPLSHSLEIRANFPDEVWEKIQDHKKILENSGEWEQRRQVQKMKWMWSIVQDRLSSDLHDHPSITEQVPELEKAVLEGKISATAAAETLLEIFRKNT